MRHFQLRRLLHYAGNILGLLGVVFVVAKLTNYGNQMDFSKLTPPVCLTLAGMAMVYGLMGFLLAFAWRDLLRYFGVSTDSFWAIRTYGVSQLAKYVPGNVFQLAGRQAIGTAAGLPAWPLAKSALWELGTISFAGCLYAFLALPLVAKNVSGWYGPATFMVALATSVWIAYRWFGLWLARSLCWYAAFLALAGLIFAAVLALVDSSCMVIASGICGSYVIAWLVGLLTPGAPAGVGVREVVLYAILHTFINKPDLLTAILMGRMITVMGDLLFYALSITFSPTRVLRQ